MIRLNDRPDDTWVYKQDSGQRTFIERVLNQQAKNGWEFVTFIYTYLPSGESAYGGDTQVCLFRKKWGQLSDEEKRYTW